MAPSSDSPLPVSHQPNVPGKGIVASYGTRFWVLVLVIGAATGLAGGALLKLLQLTERLAWGKRSGTLLQATEHAAPARLLLVLFLGGLLAGAGTLAIRRFARLGGGEVSEAIWLGDARLGLPSSLARAVLSVVTVGMGASLGREGAPQLAGAAVACRLSERNRLPAWQQRLLVACGAGAGMAAVYDVPLGGALFALEVLLGTLTLPLVLPALATTLTATATAWLLLPNRPTYAVPAYHVHASQLVWAILAGPLLGLAAVGWVRTVAAAARLRPTGRRRVLAPAVVFTALGAVAIPYPQLLGNGLDIVQLSLVGSLGIGLLLVMAVLKPLATAACLGSGAPGGLFTPTLAVGVLLGAILGHAWTLVWPGAPSGSYALIGGTGLLAAAMQGPLAAVGLMFELTRHSDTLMVPSLIVVVEATVVARLLRAPSIYSARIATGTG